jgi:quercetin dioxygenase-like cupin family protein
MIKAYKLFTGEDGHSHFEEGAVAENLIHHVEGIRFKETPADFAYDWHNAPTKQYVLTLTGTLEFETRLGEKFILRPGEVLIALDVTGSAHRWKMLGNEPWKRVYVSIKDEADLNFIPNSKD